MYWLALLVAILSEVCATSLLKVTEGFTRFWPSLGVLLGYACSFYLLSLVVKVLPVGIVYALWSGLGIVCVSIVGLLCYDQRLDLPALLGMALILAGVLVISFFSKASV